MKTLDESIKYKLIIVIYLIFFVYTDFERTFYDSRSSRRVS